MDPWTGDDEIMFELIGLVATAAATAFGYIQTRRFVRRRLAYVDAVQGGAVPVLAGVAAGLLAIPVVGLLPLVGGMTAILFGTGVGFGVASGARDVRRRRLSA